MAGVPVDFKCSMCRLLFCPFNLPHMGSESIPILGQTQGSGAYVAGGLPVFLSLCGPIIPFLHPYGMMIEEGLGRLYGRYHHRKWEWRRTRPHSIAFVWYTAPTPFCEQASQFPISDDQYRGNTYPAFAAHFFDSEHDDDIYWLICWFNSAGVS